MEIRIDRLRLPSSSPELVHFEAVVRFANGYVVVSLPYGSRAEAVTAARELANCEFNLQQSAEEAAELWAIGSEVESSEWLQYDQLGVTDQAQAP